MVANPDHFQLFELAPRFALNLAELDRAYRSVQSQVHPDRFAAGTAAESRVAMQWATRANEAYRVLKSPLHRAAYLCERAGVPIEAESNTTMPPSFLVQQLEWREALDEARMTNDGRALQALEGGMVSERDRLLGEITSALDVDGEPTRAAPLVRQLMFIEKFGSEVSTAQDVLRSHGASA